MGQILWCYHSNESSLPVLTHGASWFSKFHKTKFGRNLLLAKFGSETFKYCSMFSLRRRRNLTPVSNVCEAAPISLFSAPNGLNNLPEMRFRFPFNLIGESTMAFLTVQSWRVVKSWYTGSGPGARFSKVPVTFRARNQIFRSKYKE